MDEMEIDKCRAIPDNDPIFDGWPKGMTKLMDGIMYVRQSDWLPFLRLLWAHKSSDPAPF